MASRICADLYYDREDIEGCIEALKEAKERASAADKEPIAEAIDILTDVADEIDVDFEDEL